MLFLSISLGRTPKMITLIFLFSFANDKAIRIIEFAMSLGELESMLFVPTIKTEYLTVDGKLIF